MSILLEDNMLYVNCYNFFCNQIACDEEDFFFLLFLMTFFFFEMWGVLFVWFVSLGKSRN